MFESGLVIVAGIFLFGIFILWLYSRRKVYLSKPQFIKYRSQIQATKSMPPSYAVLESHKIFVKALSSITSKRLLKAATVIKRYEKRIGSCKRIWYYHRLRNRVAHEVGVKVTKDQAEKARKEFIWGLKNLTK